MHVAITGASSGIGRALAVEYGRAGAKLTLVARRRELLDEVAREIGRDVHVVAQDLSDPERATEWLVGAEEVNGPVDVLINNAGVMSIGATVELDAEVGQRMLDVCLSAPLRLTRAVLPGMVERGHGTVVQVASMAAVVSPPGGTWYGAAKAGLASFSEALRHELKGSGVNILTVYPGPVATPLADAGYAAYAPSRVVDSLPAGNPQELATLIRSGVAKGSPRIVYPGFYWTGKLFPGFSRWFTQTFSPKLKSPQLPEGRAAAALPSKLVQASMKTLALVLTMSAGFALQAWAQEPSRAAQEQALRSASVEELIARGRASLPGLGIYRVQLEAQERVGNTLQPAHTVQLWVREKPYAVRVQYVKGQSVGRKAIYDTEQRTDDLRVRESGVLGVVGAMWIGVHNPLVFRDTNHVITDVGFGALLRLQAQDMEKSKPFGGYVRTDEGWNERGRWCIRYDAPPKATGLYARRSHICLDPGTYLPVEMTNWDADGLLETYVFTQLEPQADGGEVFALKSAGL